MCFRFGAHRDFGCTCPARDSSRSAQKCPCLSLLASSWHMLRLSKISEGLQGCCISLQCLFINRVPLSYLAAYVGLHQLVDSATSCGQCDKSGDRKVNATKWEKNNTPVGIMTVDLDNSRIRRGSIPASRVQLGSLTQLLHMQSFSIAVGSPGLTGAECGVPLTTVSWGAVTASGACTEWYLHLQRRLVLSCSGFLLCISALSSPRGQLLLATSACA